MSDTAASHGGQFFAALKKLPYKKWWFWLALLVAVRLLVMTYENGKSPVYDPQALGFSSEDSMNAAFAKGYHTRQKMEEMSRFYAEKASTSAAAH